MSPFQQIHQQVVADNSDNSIWVNFLWSSNGFQLSVTTAYKIEAMSAEGLTDVKIAICDVSQSRLVQGPVNLDPWQFQLLGWGWLYPTHHPHTPIPVRLLDAQSSNSPRWWIYCSNFSSSWIMANTVELWDPVSPFYPYKLAYCTPFLYMSDI